MKTKELIRLLSDYAEIFDQNSGVIMGMHWTVYKKIQKLCIFGPTPRIVSQWLAEYTATPISEREEEKKYYIHLSDSVLNYDGYIGFNPICRAVQKYTQSEIDNFPPEIKGAIECGFLKKVEV